MKKQSLLLLLFVALSSLVGAQIPVPAPTKTEFKQKLNPNTDPKNQHTPDPAPAPTSRNTPTGPATGQPARPSSRTSTTPPKKTQQTATTPAPAQSAPAEGAEKQPSESAAAAKRKLIADGYMVCMTHPDYGKVYCNEAQAKGKKGHKTSYFYIDEDGIAVPIDRGAVVKAPEEEKRPLSKGKAAPALQMVRVNRWSSPVIQDFVTIPENQGTEAQLVAAGYITRIFQYEAFLTRPEGDNVAVVNRWEMGTCKEFILIAEHEISDAQMMQWGYKNKQFLFYAYKSKPASGNYVAVSRWVNALSSGSPCRDFTLSIGEHEITDSDLKSLGYSNKKVQFYVPDPR